MMPKPEVLAALGNTDALTDEILGLLVKEMSMEMGILVNRNVQKMGKTFCAFTDLNMTCNLFRNQRLIP